MLNNAYIGFINDSGGSYDSSGNPVAPTKTTTAFISCNSKEVTREYKTLVDGQYKQAKYSIYFAVKDIPTGTVINNVKEITLKDFNSNTLGTYFVHSIIPQSITKTVKMIVGL